MPYVNVQFHMLFEELIDFVANVRAQYSLSVELERWFPKTVREVLADADLATAVREFGPVDRIWLLYKPSQSQKFERFMLNVGTMRGNRLAQAGLGAGTDNEEAFGVLKKIAVELKRRTAPGIWVVSATGHVGLSKISRVSEGAADASKAGKIELTDVAFGQRMYVDPPE